MASHQLFVQNVAKKFSLFLVSKKQVLFGQKVIPHFFVRWCFSLHSNGFIKNLQPTDF